jgi:sec-independent protein translocase protein TatC
MTFWEHTEELLGRLKVPFYTLIISTAIMMVFPANLPLVFSNPSGFLEYYEPLVAIILRAIRDYALPESVKLIGMDLTTPIEIYFLASLFLGLVISAPVFAYEIFQFIDPALYPHERREIFQFMSAFLALFIAGIIVGYMIIVPFGIYALLPFFSLTGAEFLVSVSEFYYFVLFLTLVTGMMFTFPAFLAILVKYRIISTSTFAKRRKYIYVALMILVFAVTPGASPSANFILLVMMITLFEAGIFFSKRYEKEGGTGRVSLFPSQDEAKCKFCGKPVSTSTTFCLHCGKAQN